MSECIDKIKSEIRKPELFRCENKDCNYVWYSLSNLIKPTCPKCTKHQTHKIDMEQIKKCELDNKKFKGFCLNVECHNYIGFGQCLKVG